MRNPKADCNLSALGLGGSNSDQGTAARTAQRMLDAGCYVHEIYKLCSRKHAWHMKYVELKKDWESHKEVRETIFRVHQTDFSAEWTEWINMCHRSASLPLFRKAGELLAQFASECGCEAAADNLRFEFGPRRLPFHSSATGLPGDQPENCALESCHAKFDRDMFQSSCPSLTSAIKQLKEKVPGSFWWKLLYPENSQGYQATRMHPSEKNHQKGRKSNERGRAVTIAGVEGWFYPSTSIPWVHIGGKRISQKKEGESEFNEVPMTPERAKIFLEGFQGDFGSMPEVFEIDPKQSKALTQLGIFEQTYFSTHMVYPNSNGELRCTCLCFGDPVYAGIWYMLGNTRSPNSPHWHYPNHLICPQIFP